uniref:Uncharacterized protein n=1 Tax=Xiphophorus couchianus TaxID=32473 RepID=A0A3B5LSC1_9TELE
MLAPVGHQLQNRKICYTVSIHVYFRKHGALLLLFNGGWEHALTLSALYCACGTLSAVLLYLSAVFGFSTTCVFTALLFLPLQLKGHCSGVHGGGGEGVERGRVAVILEQGTPLQMIQLLQTPWEDRFRVCLDLVRLLHFLSRSPLGSVGLLDFQPRQFITVSGQLKLTDLDDVSAGEIACWTDADCTLKFPHRNFTVPCSTRGVCDGLNEKRNIYNAYRFFFTYLLPHQAPPGLTHLVDHIMNTTGELKADINQTLEAFEQILLLYKSGLHLDNLHPSALRDMSPSGNGEYRCWPSYSQQGCVLSVHSAREAAYICNSHSQCNSFTLTGQKTWTGEKLNQFLLFRTKTSSHMLLKSCL